jgi:hypothetical protein
LKYFKLSKDQEELEELFIAKVQEEKLLLKTVNIVFEDYDSVKFEKVLLKFMEGANADL